MHVVAGTEGAVHPLVGQLRRHRLGDGVHGHAEHGLLAAELNGVAVGVGGGVVAVREGDGHVKGVAGVVADDLVLKAGDEAAAAQREVVALVGAAVERHTVHGAGIINVHDVAVLRGAVGHGLGGAVLAQQAVDAGLDVRVAGG